MDLVTLSAEDGRVEVARGLQVAGAELLAAQAAFAAACGQVERALTATLEPPLTQVWLGNRTCLPPACCGLTCSPATRRPGS